MIVTKEHQEAMVENYMKAGHTTDETLGFIDGLNAALDFIFYKLEESNKAGSI